MAKPDGSVTTKARSVWSKLSDSDGFRRAGVLIALAIVWQAYAIFVHNELVLPKLTDVLLALWKSTANGVSGADMNSLQTLVTAMRSNRLGINHHRGHYLRVGSDFRATLTAMFNPLPAIALLPLAMLCSASARAACFLCSRIRCFRPFALNTHAGYLAVSETCAWRDAIAASTRCPMSCTYDARRCRRSFPGSRSHGRSAGGSDRSRTGVRRVVVRRRRRLVHLRKRNDLDIPEVSPACWSS